MTRPITLACAAVVLLGAAVSVYLLLPEPVPEPTIELHGRSRQNEGPPPKLEVAGGFSHKFDEMMVGIKGRHAFEFKNVGSGPLDVWLEETTCSCTVASLKAADGQDSRRLTIEPGKSAPLEVTWEGKKAGRFAQAAMLGTNDPEHQQITLSIYGDMVLAVEVRPSESLSVPDATAEETRRTTASIISFDRPELKLTKVVTSRPEVAIVETKPMTPAELARWKGKAGYDLTIEIKPGLPTGRFAEDVLIETDHPDRPSLKVAVKGITLGMISAVPPRIEMPSVPSLSGATKDVILIVHGDRDVTFEVASKPKDLRVEISPEVKKDSRGEHRHRLTVTVPPRLARGPLDGPIVLKTDHPQMKELRIPVAIYISNRSEAG